MEIMRRLIEWLTFTDRNREGSGGNSSMQNHSGIRLEWLEETKTEFQPPYTSF
jgi:hypothetical protein